MKKKFPKIFGKSEPKPWETAAQAPKVSQFQSVKPDSLLIPRNMFEPVVSQPIELDRFATELTIRLRDADGDREINTCYGDIYKIINALMDYARLLEMACTEWNLQGFHRATYEHHAEKLRAIAKKYQDSIGYDYDAAVAECKARKKRTRNNDDVGGDAVELAVKRGRQESKKEVTTKKENIT